MKHIQKIYFLVLFITLAPIPLHASEQNQKQQLLDADFFDAAKSTKLTPPEKYEKLSTLLAQKANITTHYPGATSLYNLIQVAGFHKRDDTDSIKLLIDSGSPLKTTQVHKISILELAINEKMYPVIQILVDTKADLAEQSTTGEMCLHQIADHLMFDETACKIFDILKQHGNLPIDNLNWYNQPAVHLSRNQSRSGKNLTRRLLAHGANPYCPPSRGCACHEKDDADTRAIHEAWKAEANRAVLVKIPIVPVKNMVIDYCFWNPRLEQRKK